MSLERRKLLTAYGARRVLTDGKLGMAGAIATAQAMASSDPDRYVLLQQFPNPANPQIHHDTTGPEIWDATDGQVDVLVAVAVEPDSSPVITQTLAGEDPQPGPHRIQGIGAGFVPGNLDVNLIDQVERVSNSDAIAMAQRLMTGAIKGRGSKGARHSQTAGHGRGATAPKYVAFPMGIPVF